MTALIKEVPYFKVSDLWNIKKTGKLKFIVFAIKRLLPILERVQNEM